jgi:hypothetical protein
MAYGSRAMRMRMRMKPRSGTKGARSKTRRGDLDFTTKSGDRDFHRAHHDILKGRAPFEKVAKQLRKATCPH